MPCSAPAGRCQALSGARALPGGDCFLDLAREGKAPDLLLREDELAVQPDVEDAAAALDQLGADAQLLLQLVRQTGGARQVVSGHAVLDGNVFSHD
jgi:cell division FtsZ-interacting protein ZapD